jgi:putative tryptophan/tyrosine transport system substrate-binding protein
MRPRVLRSSHSRRVLLGLAAGATAGLYLEAAAQRGRKSRIGVLMGYAAADTDAQQWLATFKMELVERGWPEGQTEIEVRWTGGEAGTAPKAATELLALNPDVIIANTTPAAQAAQRATKLVPIVFVIVSDPVGTGLVQSFSQPGGNVTGFVNFESSLVEKWLELLKEIAPQATEVGVMFNPRTAPYAERYLTVLEAAAARLNVKATRVVVGTENDILDAVVRHGAKPDSGLLLMTDSFLFVHRKLIIEEAARQRVPCVYFVKNAPIEGGLVSYGIDGKDLFRKAAQYTDRILRGQMPATLPVQLPTKFELFVNVRTARALGLSVPQSILARADGVIE